jgi:hypothetical protein
MPEALVADSLTIVQAEPTSRVGVIQVFGLIG